MPGGPKMNIKLKVQGILLPKLQSYLFQEYISITSTIYKCGER